MFGVGVDWVLGGVLGSCGVGKGGVALGLSEVELGGFESGWIGLG